MYVCRFLEKLILFTTLGEKMVGLFLPITGSCGIETWENWDVVGKVQLIFDVAWIWISLIPFHSIRISGCEPSSIKFTKRILHWLLIEWRMQAKKKKKIEVCVFCSPPWIHVFTLLWSWRWSTLSFGSFALWCPGGFCSLEASVDHKKMGREKRILSALALCLPY